MNSSEGRLHSCPPRAAPVLHPAAFSLPPAAWPDPDHYSHLVPAPGTFRPSCVSASCPQPSVQLPPPPGCQPLCGHSEMPTTPFLEGPPLRSSPLPQSLPPVDLLYPRAHQAEEATGQAAICLPSMALGQPSCLPHSKEVIRTPDTSHPHVCPDKGPSCTGGPQQEQPLCAAPATLCAPVCPQPLSPHVSKLDRRTITSQPRIPRTSQDPQVDAERPPRAVSGKGLGCPLVGLQDQARRAPHSRVIGVTRWRSTKEQSKGSARNQFISIIRVD